MATSGPQIAKTGKYGDLHGRWLEFAATTVSGDVAVLHSGSAGGGGR